MSSADRGTGSGAWWVKAMGEDSAIVKAGRWWLSVYMSIVPPVGLVYLVLGFLLAWAEVASAYGWLWGTLLALPGAQGVSIASWLLFQWGREDGEGEGSE